MVKRRGFYKRKFIKKKKYRGGRKQKGTVTVGVRRARPGVINRAIRQGEGRLINYAATLGAGFIKDMILGRYNRVVQANW